MPSPIHLLMQVRLLRTPRAAAPAAALVAELCRSLPADDAVKDASCADNARQRARPRVQEQFEAFARGSQLSPSQETKIRRRLEVSLIEAGHVAAFGKSFAFDVVRAPDLVAASKAD